MKNSTFLKSFYSSVFSVFLIGNVYTQPYPVHNYPYVSFYKNEFLVPASGTDTIKVILHSDTTWSTNIDAEWLTRDKGIGSYNDTLTVTVEENTGDSARTAVLSVSADGAPVQSEVRFYQAAYNPELTAPTDTIILGDTLKWSDTIEIISNTAWTVASSAKWLNVAPVNGINNKSIIITADRNFTSKERIAVISISAYDTDTVFIPVKQAEGDTSLSPKDNAFQIIPDSHKSPNRYLKQNKNSLILTCLRKKLKYTFYV